MRHGPREAMVVLGFSALAACDGSCRPPSSDRAVASIIEEVEERTAGPSARLVQSTAAVAAWGGVRFGWTVEADESCAEFDAELASRMMPDFRSSPLDGGRAYRRALAGDSLTRRYVCTDADGGKARATFTGQLTPS